MIVALFFVAAAMMAGGAWAVFTGWELIIIERGWTQVLLGGMLVTGGLLLAGVGVLAVHVKRLAEKFEQISMAKPSPMGAAAPAKREEMPSRPPRQEPRSEPRPAPGEEPRLQVEPEPVAAPVEETGKPAAPAMSAPAAIALGAAAGAGTAAVASAILSSSAESRLPPEAEPPAEDERVGKVSSERLFADIEEPAAPTPGDEIMPTPDGEDRAMVLTPEGADAVAEAALEGEEHVVPPVVETAHLDDAPEETERAPPAEEEPYSAPTEERVEEERAEGDRVEDVLPDLDEPPLPPETTPDIAEPFVEEERAVAGTSSDELAQDFSEVEGPLMEEESLMGGEPRFEEFAAEERLPEPEASQAPEPEPMPPEEPEMAEPVSRDEGAPEEVAEPEAEPAPRSVVGTYKSGGNVYTMYSDGSIDARTPSGDFHFASLDELKNFIAEGGEDPLT